MNQQGPKRVRSRELEWYELHRGWLESEFPGQWVAIKGEELVAVGETLDVVMDAAERKGISRPLVTAVKRKELQGFPMIR
jgi:hypothetical protein